MNDRRDFKHTAVQTWDEAMVIVSAKKCIMGTADLCCLGAPARPRAQQLSSPWFVCLEGDSTVVDISWINTLEYMCEK